MKSKVIRDFRALLVPGLDSGNVKHVFIMFQQLWKFTEVPRNCWVAFPQEVVEYVEENDVSIGQLKKKEEKTKVLFTLNGTGT